MKPSPIQPGDRIGVISPGSAPSDPAKLKAGIARLESLGFEVEMAGNDLEPHGYLSATDPERLAAINGMLSRSDVSALFATRGGYGCLRLLEKLDYEAARSHPKLLVGYSDITALQFALFERAGWPGLSGPMVAIDWPDIDATTERIFWDMAAGAWHGQITGPDGEQLTGLRSGAVEGVLVGGNLTVISTLIGSRFMPALKNAILFIEDVGEPPYRIDRMLAHLRHAGVLGSLGGLVVGRFTGWEPDPDERTLSYEEVIEHYSRFVHGPVATGLMYGHVPVKNTMPIGVRAVLDVIDVQATLTINEAVTR